ncbi:hypothetical protein HFV06_01200 [Pseudomonas fluorescens]|jgi:hypothetical protein|uniref:hypothetical protein n=1 Tax=Pseudomonas TaxID=286 RepID=UPI00114D27B1|nr:hypothetical protein [Pseudomonas sp. AP19]NKI45827.1 hypothetical protein [Pseudomonas fluorescens]NKI53360.1 hypothetical protein [Pseudomonas fluorescens]NKI62449.1 hypothetical protein [Pseudomonas fluorescens]
MREVTEKRTTDMEDVRAVELYAEFRRSYQTKRVTISVSSPDLADDLTMPAFPMMFHQAVSDPLREMSRSTNDFQRWINMLAAWEPIYEACNQDEKLSILGEHIAPISALVLGAPQALRGRMIFAAATGCGHANYHLSGTRPDLQWNGSGHLTMSVASRIGQPWAKWRQLAPILGELGRGSISEDTDDYRNQREHGHPRNIGMGLTASVSVTEDAGGRSWGFGSKEAIPLETVINVAVGQHAVVVRAYEALCDLAHEQFEALMVFDRTNTAT